MSFTGKDGKAKMYCSLGVWLFLVVAACMARKGAVVCCCVALLLSFLVV